LQTPPPPLPTPFPTRRSSDLHPSNASSPSGSFWYMPGSGDILGLDSNQQVNGYMIDGNCRQDFQSGRHFLGVNIAYADGHVKWRSEEHTSELQSRENLVCRLL